MNELTRWRDEFPILATTTYLISNSLGAMPRRVSESLASYAEAWAVHGVRAWESGRGGWWPMPGVIGDLIAPIIGAGPGEVVTQLNVSLASAMILSCFDFRPPRNRIVFTELEFPSVRYVHQALRGSGADVVCVPSPDGIRTDTGRLLEAIDERTLLVPVSHVLFRSAFIQDVRAIVQRAHEVGAYVVLDTYHSAGVVPFSVSELGVDFAIGGVLKWLCGGPGVAFLYVRPDLRARLTPRLAGWMAHARPFAFEPEMELRDDAWRFMSGTPQIPALYAARPGLEIIGTIGVEAIRARSLELTQLLIDLAQERGWRINSPLEPKRRGGTVTVDVPEAERVCHELLEQNYLVDYRPHAGIRIAPHFYNTEEEVRAVVNAIETR